MTTISVPLSKLVLSPLNVRQTTADDDTGDLEASILEHGLLSPLTAHPMAKGKYGVIAGGRRLRALQALIEAKRLDAKHEVDVVIRDEDDATAIEISTVENTARVALPAAMEYAAFAKLAADGDAADPETIAAIARRFATTELHVRQRMRLGRLHPDILIALGEGRMTLDTAKVYASTTDQDLQLRVFNQLGRGGYHYEVRAALNRDLASAGVDHMIKLVGIEPYTAAGGRADEDLFVPGAFRVLDVELLQSLYRDRVDEETTALNLPDNVTLQFNMEGLGRPVLPAAELTDKQLDRRNEIDIRITEISGRLEEIADWDADGPSDRLVAIAGQDQGEVNNLIAESRRLEVESESLADSALPDGPIVAVARIEDHFAGPRITIASYWRPAAWVEPEEGGGPNPARQSTAASGPAPVANAFEENRRYSGLVQPEQVAKDEHGLSKDGVEVMQSLRRQTFAALLLDAPDNRRLAAEYLQFAIARGLLTSTPSYELGLHRLPAREYDPHVAKEDLGGHLAARELADLTATLAAQSWAKEKNLGLAFDRYVDLPAADRITIGAWCATALMSRSLNAPGFAVGPHDMLADMVGADALSLRFHWSPDERFFARLPKARRLDAIAEIDPAFKGKVSTLGNADLTKAAAAIMAAEPETVRQYGMSDEAVERARQWLPEYLRFAAPNQQSSLEPNDVAIDDVQLEKAA